MDTIREELTPRELEILRLVATGLSDKVIAKQLGIARSTVSNHVSVLLIKLRARNRAGAVRCGFEVGLLPVTGTNP